MNTFHVSTASSEPQNQGPLDHQPTSPPPPAAVCSMAATGRCMVRDLCRITNENAPPGFSANIAPRRLIRRGKSLYRAGDTLANLYQLYAGSMKLRITNCAGMEQIASFPMAGALLGLDGIETGTYACDAIALEDSLVCVLPFSELVASCGCDAMAALQLNKAIAQETTNYRSLLMIMAGMNSEARIASFLIDISERMVANGYSAREFVLKMTREDIAHHLGMKLETVSRMFTRLQAAHILDVSRRHINIRDPHALKKIGASH